MAVTAAITSYNAKDYLTRLLTQARAQGFQKIIVLDDASTDGSVAWLKRQPDIELIAGPTNLGPTGNRNRILSAKTDDLIVFLDVDMELVGENMAAKLESEFAKYPDAAVVSPLILSHANEPMWYNWGYDSSPRRDGLAEALNQIALAHSGKADVMATVREIARGQVGHFESVKNREVDWVVEQCFAVRADIFRKLGGFDPEYRMFQEGPDYCLRARQAGYKVRLTTAVTAKHLDLRSGSSKQRAADLRTSMKHYYRKHFHIPDEIIEQFFL